MKLSNPEVERELLASILQRRRPELYQVLSAIDPEVFSVVTYQWLFRAIIEYYQRYRLPPPRDVLRMRVAEEFAADQAKREVHEPLLGLYEHRLSFDEYAKEQFLDYVAARTYLKHSEQALTAYTRSNDVGLLLRDSLVASNKAQAVRVGLPLEDYAEGWRKREEERRYRRLLGEGHAAFRFGLPELDAQIRWEPGLVCGFLGPFKRYKSVILNHCAFAALVQGFNVLQVVYENTLNLTNDRHDSRFTGVSYDRLRNWLKTGEERARADWLMANVDAWKQRLVIVKARPGVTSVADIEAVVQALGHTDGFIPDVTIWDYANLIKPSEHEKDERLAQTQIVWDLVAHAQDPRRPRLVVSAWQAKMEGVKVDRLDATHFGKSIGIIQALDLAIGINQTETERIDNQLIFSLLSYRHGPILQPHCLTICEIERMCVGQETDDLWTSLETPGAPHRFRPEQRRLL